MPWRGTATRRASPPPRSGARAGERGQYRKRAMGKPCVRAQEPLPSHSGFIKAPARSGAFRGPKGKCRHTRLLGVKDAGRAASRGGCRGQGREPGRGERATNSQMNGSNFRCFMEETASRQRDGERREPPRVCKLLHAHTEPARSPGGCHRWWLAPTWWARLFWDRPSRGTTGCCSALLPPPHHYYFEQQPG